MIARGIDAPPCDLDAEERARLRVTRNIKDLTKGPIRRKDALTQLDTFDRTPTPISQDQRTASKTRVDVARLLGEPFGQIVVSLRTSARVRTDDGAYAISKTTLALDRGWLRLIEAREEPRDASIIRPDGLRLGHTTNPEHRHVSAPRSTATHPRTIPALRIELGDWAPVGALPHADLLLASRRTRCRQVGLLSVDPLVTKTGLPQPGLGRLRNLHPHQLAVLGMRQDKVRRPPPRTGHI